MWQQISVLVRHSLPLLFTHWCFHTVPLLSALSLSSILYIWLMKKKTKQRINGVSALRQQKCGMEINLLAQDKRSAKITAGKRKLHHSLILEDGESGGGQWKDKRGVWGGGWRGLERCDRVERDWGGSSCSPAGQRCSAIGFVSEWRILWMLSGMGSVARNYMHIRINAQESNI